MVHLPLCIECHHLGKENVLLLFLWALLVLLLLPSSCVRWSFGMSKTTRSFEKTDEKKKSSSVGSRVRVRHASYTSTTPRASSRDDRTTPPPVLLMLGWIHSPRASASLRVKFHQTGVSCSAARRSWILLTVLPGILESPGVHSRVR